MGCDIHWTIERLHQDGIWEGVLSKAHFYDQAAAGGFLPWKMTGADRDAFYKKPQYQLGSRWYELFAALSDVRNDDGEVKEFALTFGVPADASKQFMQELDAIGSDGHSEGWALGSTVLSWRAKRKSPLATWARLLNQVLKAKHCDMIMSDRTTGHEDFSHEEFAGGETAHETLARATRSSGLLCWKANPDAWRVLVFYDN